MIPSRRIFWRWHLGVTGLLLLAAIALISLGPRPAEPAGPGAILYLHLPAAVNMFVGAFVTFIAGVGFLGSRRRLWDDLAVAATQVTLVCCSVVLLTGVIWARSAWGSWWTWSPRLTFSLVLWLLYATALLVRPMIKPAARRAMVSAVYCIIAFIDVPLVYLTVKLLPDVHPASVELSAGMRRTLLVCLLATTCASAGLLIARYTAARKTPTM
jgi:heme exporter protein C